MPPASSATYAALLHAVGLRAALGAVRSNSGGIMVDMGVHDSMGGAGSRRRVRVDRGGAGRAGTQPRPASAPIPWFCWRRPARDGGDDLAGAAVPAPRLLLGRGLGHQGYAPIPFMWGGGGGCGVRSFDAPADRGVRACRSAAVSARATQAPDAIAAQAVAARATALWAMASRMPDSLDGEDNLVDLDRGRIPIRITRAPRPTDHKRAARIRPASARSGRNSLTAILTGLLAAFVWGQWKPRGFTRSSRAMSPESAAGGGFRWSDRPLCAPIPDFRGRTA